MSDGFTDADTVLQADLGTPDANSVTVEIRHLDLAFSSNSFHLAVFC